MLIKICGITRQEDLCEIAKLPVQMCGFIFHPASPRYIQPAKVALLESGELKRVGVFVHLNAEAILAHMREARLDFAQFHGRQTLEDAAKIGRERVIRVLWPQKYTSLDDLRREAEKWSGHCAYFLLDAGVQGGGSGVNLVWKDLAGLSLPRPWLLAGGLGTDNLERALGECQPAGVDLNSGVEKAPGVKDCEAIARIMNQLKRPI